jgi:hypothetical protein
MFRIRSTTIARSLVSLATGLVLVACGGTPDPYLTAPRDGGTDKIRPTVLATNPGSGQVGVPRNTLIQITFSEPLDSASVSNAAVTFSGGVTGTIQVTGASVTVIPYPPLPPNTTITGTITGIRDRSGNVLSAPYVWTFTTAP